MISLLVAFAAATAAPKAVGLSRLASLEGCWQVQGQVRGKDAASIAKGEWHLGGRYFTLHLRATTEHPYEAAITFGAGETSDDIGSIWSDTFGGLYEPSLGLGGLVQGGFEQTYRFPDALYVNRFEITTSGWHWTIVERAPGKPDKLFAEYRLSKRRCAGMKFGY